MIDLTEVRNRFQKLANISPLAEGGQKEVCRAELNGTSVVLKLILPNPGAEERAIRELQAIKQLSSDYVPHVIESGETVLGGKQRHYIIEPFIDGETYRERLTKTPRQDFAFVLYLTRALLTGAADSEKIGIVHRDIKPENLMVDTTGKVWILDFGIARHLKRSSLTPSGGFGVGTIGYAPPEQYRNMKPEIDGRADLFSIGMVVHESLLGKHFYWDGAADPIAVIHRMDKVDLPRLTVTEDPLNEFVDFIATLCQRFPSRRPPSAADALKWFMPIEARLRS